MGSRTVRFLENFYDNFHGLFTKDTVYKDIPDDIILPTRGVEILSDASQIGRDETVKEKVWEKRPDDHLVGITRARSTAQKPGRSVREINSEAEAKARASAPANPPRAQRRSA